MPAPGDAGENWTDRSSWPKKTYELLRAATQPVLSIAGLPSLPSEDGLRFLWLAGVPEKVQDELIKQQQAAESAGDMVKERDLQDARGELSPNSWAVVAIAANSTHVSNALRRPSGGRLWELAQVRRWSPRDAAC